MDRKPFSTPRAGPTDSFVRDAQSFSNSWTRRTARLTILMASYKRARISRSFGTPGACLARKLSCISWNPASGDLACQNRPSASKHPKSRPGAAK